MFKTLFLLFAFSSQKDNNEANNLHRRLSVRVRFVCNCKAITFIEILDRLLKALDYYNNKLLQALQINRSHCKS